MAGNIAKRWKELSGEKNWENLLDPLDFDLRMYIIHYGEMAQATYDAFNSECTSKYAGDCRYSKGKLFSKVGLAIGHPLVKYKPVKYLYAASKLPVASCFILKSLSSEAWDKESNWIGYIAVATDEGKEVLGRRDILISWRGTVQAYEFITDFNFPLVPAREVIPRTSNPMVHQGWLSIYTTKDPRSQFNKSSVRDQVLVELKRLIKKYEDDEISITITGHSLGAALATLNAVDIVANGFNKCDEVPDKSITVTAFPFASPHVGDLNFADVASSLEDLHILRIRNFLDIVPTYPQLIGYMHVGKELLINDMESPYVRKPGNYLCWHELELYLHGVAGTLGSQGGFNLVVKRDISLINKRMGALKDEYDTPESWWCEKNKGMVQKEDGSWELHDQDHVEIDE